MWAGQQENVGVVAVLRLKLTSWLGDLQLGINCHLLNYFTELQTSPFAGWR